MDSITQNAAYFATLASLLIAFLVIGFRRGPAMGMAIVFPVAMAIPAWIYFPVFTAPEGTIVGAGPDVKVTLGMIALAFYSFMPGATFPVKLTWCDYFMIALVTVNFTSDCANNGFQWKYFAEIFGEWYVPYMVGRLAVQNVELLQACWKSVSVVVACLGIVSIIEAFANVNLFEQFYGLRALEMTPRDAERWGLRRAYGPCLNPIYFGVLQLILLGWTIFAARSALAEQVSKAWIAPSILGVAGIICTCSRGPILGLALLIPAALFFYWRPIRKPALVLSVLFVASSPLWVHSFVNVLEDWSGENKRTSVRNVTEDVNAQYTGTRSRLLALKLYETSIKRSGWLGFGSKAVSGFPVRIPLGEEELKLLERLKYVDNTYLLLLLRFGFLGLIAFAGAIGLAIYQFIRICDENQDMWPGQLAGMVGIAFLATAPVIATVWMPHDFGYSLIWTLGVSSGLIAASHFGLLEPSLYEEEFDDSYR